MTVIHDPRITTQQGRFSDGQLYTLEEVEQLAHEWIDELSPRRNREDGHNVALQHLPRMAQAPGEGGGWEMRGEPLMVVTCDICEDELEVSLTSLAGGGWDDRGVDSQLRRAGWTKNGDRDLCSGCEGEDDE